MNSIFARRSIRKYHAKPIEKEKIRILLGAAMAAPTARNQREWEFVVVTADGIRRQLSEVSPYNRACGSGAAGDRTVADKNPDDFTEIF